MFSGVPRESNFDFGVARHRLFLARLRIQVDVMLGARPEKYAAILEELAGELFPLHIATSFVS
jgi:hypothetical protein